MYVYLNRAHAEIYVPQRLTNCLERPGIFCTLREITRIENNAFPTLRERGQWQGECVGSKKDGSRFPLEISLVMMKDGGIACIARDVTERKSLEQQKADLFAMVSHDIKSPLTAILGYAEMLIQDAEPERESYQMINSIRSSCRKINGIMEDFLTLSHLESVKVLAEGVRLRPGRPVQQTEKDFSIQARRKLHFQVNTEPGLPLIKVDKIFLQRALFNLITPSSTHSRGRGYL